MTVLDAPALLGSQEPTVTSVPEHVSSAGHEAALLADRAGLVLDPWQRQVLIGGLGERADGRWAAFEVGVMVARQNGKGAIAEARVLAGLFLLGERLIMYSAHEFKTASEMFRRILELIEGTPAFSRRVKAVARSKGEEGIELTTGQRLRFLARSTGSGRGFSGDCNLLDEAQHLGEAPVDALMPTMSARPNPQLWYLGSAPDKDLAPCEPFARVRSRAMVGDAKRLAYFEWSAALCGDQCGTDCDQHDDASSPLTWAKTNPGMGIRISEEHIATERESMSPRGFARERLSVGNYPTVGGGWEVFSQPAWTGIEDEASTPADPVAFAVEVAPERNAAAISVAGAREDGLLHGEVVDYRPGTSWVVPRLETLRGRWGPCAVAIAPAGPTGSLQPDLEDAGFELTLVKGRDTGAACGSLYDAIVRPPDAEPGWAPTMRVRPHPALTAAVAGAARRFIGDAWVFDRRGSAVDPAPLISLVVARWAFLTRERIDDGPPNIW
ncbi:terminase [Actinomadura alba]|uniref:Terminase n=1 Tax=Actinomadura alba TaxID=406431 RepID=A0ABR7LHD9_9ACTN|nr:terminase [Actinomadura alba]MBC6464266.1 terminase [Actinomadura alba]